MASRRRRLGFRDLHSLFLLTGLDSQRQYKKQLDDWFLKKNIRSDHMKAMLHIQRRRRRDEKKETRFTRHGVEVPPEKLIRFARRRRSSPDPPDDEEGMSRIYRLPTLYSSSHEKDPSRRLVACVPGTPPG